MLTEVGDVGCARCYQLEESGFMSMRENLNLMFREDIPLALDTNEDGSFNTKNFKYIDIRFSNLCNFKCRGCGPTLSSAWYDDHQILYNYTSDQAKVKSVSVNSPEFWRELKSLIPHAEMIYFGGGEPLITKEHFEVLKLLESLDRFDVRLTYNTNLSQLNYGSVNLEEMWAKFKDVTLGISIDDIGPRGEYFRHGTKWEVIEKNIVKISENYSNVKCYINCTVNIMNVFYLPEIYEYLINKKIISPNDFNINLLLDPIELRVQVLSRELKDKVRIKLKTFQESLLARGSTFQKAANDIGNILNFLYEEDMSDQLPLFKEHTLKLDQIRHESFINTFPELSSLVN